MSEPFSQPSEARRAAGDPRPDVGRTNALHQRLFDNALGALELYTIYVGEQLGLYRALAENGPATWACDCCFSADRSPSPRLAEAEP